MARRVVDDRLGRVDEAIVKLESFLTDYPNDSEAIAYLGRIYKEMWVDSWIKISGMTTRGVPAAILLCLGVGALCGLLNGLGVVLLRVSR